MYTDPEAYDRYMGRWSARLAPLFIRFAAIGDGQRVLDVGCGTGVLGLAVTTLMNNAQVVGIDPVPPYVAYARKRTTDSSVRFEVGSAEALSFGDASFDTCMALLVLQEFPDAPHAVAEMRRVTRPGGRVAACQWDFRTGMPMLSVFWDAVEAVNPGTVAARRAAKQETGKRAYQDEDELAALWTAGGLVEVYTTSLDIPMNFASFEDFWSPFLSGATPTTAYAPTLPAEARLALAEHLREKLLGGRPDGPFTLEARALAVRGTVPGT